MLGPPDTAVDESCCTSWADGAWRPGVSPMKAGIMAGDSHCQERHRKAGTRRKYQHVSPPTLWSLAGASHWPSPIMHQPAKGLRGIQSTAGSPQVQSKAGKDGVGSGAAVGVHGDGTNREQPVHMVAHRPSVVHSVGKGGRDAFYKKEPLVNVPPSDAHTKYWCKNGSGLNTHQCFLMCL